MAEGLLKHELPNVEIFSAGLEALIGHEADPKAQKLMGEAGIDISGHRGRQIDGAACRRADLILVMDTQQRLEVENRYPFTKGRVFRLGEVSKQDVFDPYLMDEDAFKSCFQLVAQGVIDWKGRILRVA